MDNNSTNFNSNNNINNNNNNKINDVRPNKLSFNIDYSLTKLLEKEILLERNILILLDNLRLRYDFDIHCLFHIFTDCHCIDLISIQNFLDRVNANFLNSDIYFIMKRLDLNKDGIIDMCDFSNFFGFPYSLDNLSNNSKCNFSPDRRKIDMDKDNYGRISPNLNIRKSPERYGSPNRYSYNYNNNNNNTFNNSNQNYQTFNNSNNNLNNNNNNNNFNNTFNSNNINNNFNNTNNSSNNNFVKTNEANFNSGTNYNIPSNNSTFNNNNNNNTNNFNNTNNNPNNNSININTINNNTNFSLENQPIYESPNIQPPPIEKLSIEEEQLRDYLKNIMQCESILEQQKIDISLQKDFSFEDIYKLFTISNNTFICPKDLIYSLNNFFEIILKDSECEIFYKRYDLDKKGFISYQDFFDILVPFEKKYRDRIEYKEPLNCCINIYQNCVLSYTTRLYIKNLFNDILNYEKKFHYMKRNFTNMRLSLNKLFINIDIYNRGFFTEEDLCNYLKNMRIFTNNKDADLLFIRLDKNRDGKVDLNEFEEELIPLF